MMTNYLFEPADTIKTGDIVPECSVFPVARVIVFPFSHVRVTFKGTTFTKDFPHGGPDFGFPTVRLERY